MPFLCVCFSETTLCLSAAEGYTIEENISMVVSGSPKRCWVAYNPPIGSIYHLYTTYILPSGGLYATYHLLGEPETTIEHWAWLVKHLQPEQAEPSNWLGRLNCWGLQKTRAGWRFRGHGWCQASGPHQQLAQGILHKQDILFRNLNLMSSHTPRRVACESSFIFSPWKQLKRRDLQQMGSAFPPSGNKGWIAGLIKGNHMVNKPWS